MENLEAFRRTLESIHRKKWCKPDTQFSNHQPCKSKIRIEQCHQGTSWPHGYSRRRELQGMPCISYRGKSNNNCCLQHDQVSWKWDWKQKWLSKQRKLNRYPKNHERNKQRPTWIIHWNNRIKQKRQREVAQEGGTVRTRASSRRVQQAKRNRAIRRIKWSALKDWMKHSNHKNKQGQVIG